MTPGCLFLKTAENLPAGPKVPKVKLGVREFLGTVPSHPKS